MKVSDAEGQYGRNSLFVAPNKESFTKRKIKATVLLPIRCRNVFIDNLNYSSKSWH